MKGEGGSRGRKRSAEPGSGSLWGIVVESGVSENPKLHSLFWETGSAEREYAQQERDIYSAQN